MKDARTTDRAATITLKKEKEETTEQLTTEPTITADEITLTSELKEAKEMKTTG